ncbi:MAG: integrase [Alphaproteobacteria bacterium]|nr:integrase [Alphaproteobacteria bacterium]|tara:strand:- start:5928 stop:7091 length:1164 start_codon:yes stop_codon:yes gene_type:complete
MPKMKLLKSSVDAVPNTEKGQIFFHDENLSGFMLIVGKTAKTYAVQKDINGKSVRYTIGRHGHFTPDEARSIAKEKLYLMAQGINPHEREKEDRKAIVTLRHVLKCYRETKKGCSDSTAEKYEYQLNKYAPDWLDLLIEDIDRDMVVARHSYIGKHNGEATANGVMRIMRALFNFAHATFDICVINPVSYLSKVKAWYPNKRRRSYIKPHQLNDWWKGVESLDNDTISDYIFFLLFTGLRRNEAASLKWENVDFNDRTFTIPTTKNGDPLTLPLSNFLYEMLQKRRQRYGNYEYVFPGPGKHGYLAEPKKGIYKVIERTGIQFTCHDLRRTYITIAESLDISAYALKRLINHRVTDVTGGYIMNSVERLRDPVNRISNFILESSHGH